MIGANRGFAGAMGFEEAPVKGVVDAGSGLVRGAREGDVWVFRSIPYAADPSVPRRWRRPVKPPHWVGVREAPSWGPKAPQNPAVGALNLADDPKTQDEDCLSLNVWTPALDDRTRPVMVWFHGGGFTSGTGASVVFRGDRLAARGDVVVVTFNYRLGALGFLAHPALDEGDGAGCGNWGLWDQIAALEWVSENIASFGGDPDNVTVFGESAGAMSISTLLATGASGRLFHKAVIQSGPPATGSRTWATRRALRLAQLLRDASTGAGLRLTTPSVKDPSDLVGDPPFDRETLSRVAPVQLVEAVARLAGELAHEEGLPLPLLPVVDGALLEREPGSAISDGAAASVPLLIGSNREEASLFIAPDPRARDIGIDAVTKRIARATSLDVAHHLLDVYTQARRGRGEPTTPCDLIVAVTTDYVFRMPSLALAAAAYKHQPATFAYLFSWQTPLFGGIFGSAHGLEIPFVFGTMEDDAIAAFTGGGEQAIALSRAMQQAWVAFARRGDPSCDALGEWQPYDPLRRSTMVLGADQELTDDPRRSERLAWEEAGLELSAGHHHEV
jgi:para-nitrobenzyl esterase